ncbi:MAG: hypothetical protein STHCBS139747_000179 [Sporothrix thermara]
MAEQLLDQVRDIVEGQIVVTFVVGYVLQDIKLAVYIALGGTAVTFIATIPPWPFYNQNPVKWLPVGGGKPGNISIPQTIVIDEKAIH